MFLAMSSMADSVEEPSPNRRNIVEVKLRLPKSPGISRSNMKELFLHLTEETQDSRAQMYADIFTAFKYILPDPAITRMPRKLSSLIRRGSPAMRWSLQPALLPPACVRERGGLIPRTQLGTEKDGGRLACV